VSIAVHEDYEIFTLDVTSVFLNTLMPDEVKHKRMKFDKDVTAMLVEINREHYLPYVQADETMVVHNNKLVYGYVEASHYWYKTFAEVFVTNGWEKCMKDKCVFVK
jgi:hypothetical protein